MTGAAMIRSDDANAQSRPRARGGRRVPTRSGLWRQSALGKSGHQRALDVRGTRHREPNTVMSAVVHALYPLQARVHTLTWEADSIAKCTRSREAIADLLAVHGSAPHGDQAVEGVYRDFRDPGHEVRRVSGFALFEMPSPTLHSGCEERRSNGTTSYPFFHGVRSLADRLGHTNESMCTSTTSR